MYINNKDIDTIAELSAMVDGALESADGIDEKGNDIVEYWLDLSKRVENLEKKIHRQYNRQKK